MNGSYFSSSNAILCSLHKYNVVNFMKIFFVEVSRIDALTKKATDKISPEGRTYHQVPEGLHPMQ